MFRTALIQHLRDMEYTTFTPLLQGVYKQFLSVIQSIQTQNNIMNDLLDSLQYVNIIFSFIFKNSVC